MQARIQGYRVGNNIKWIISIVQYGVPRFKLKNSKLFSCYIKGYTIFSTLTFAVWVYLYQKGGKHNNHLMTVSHKTKVNKIQEGLYKIGCIHIHCHLPFSSKPDCGESSMDHKYTL